MTTLIVRKHPVYSPRFWKAYFIQMRPYLLFISGIAGAAGMAMAKKEDTEGWRLVVSFIPFFMGYGFGQALTDCFQTDTDKLSAPYRPLSQGIVSLRTVLGVSIAALLACAVILFLLHPLSFLFSGLAVFGLATYSYIKKNIWFGGPFYNAFIVALLPLMGYFAMLAPYEKHFPAYLIPYILLTFFSYASFVLIGYLKDIEADRATHYKTFPVVWGWHRTMLFGDCFALATLVLFWLQPKSNLYEVTAGLIGSVFIISGQVQGHITRQKNERGALLPILATVRSFIFFHMAIVLHFQAGWWPYMMMYYILFELFLSLRPSRYQV